MGDAWDGRAPKDLEFMRPDEGKMDPLAQNQEQSVDQSNNGKAPARLPPRCDAMRCDAMPDGNSTKDLPRWEKGSR